MTVLRVLLAAAAAPARDAAWALFDAHERRLRAGCCVPSSWPAAERKDAVVAASSVRLASLALPPLSADRVAAAAAFALEDQLAGPAHEQHLAASAQRRDGTVQVAIVARELVASLRNAFARVVAEPAIAPIPPARHWAWYTSGADGGFVRKPDGSAFAVSSPRTDAGVPGELGLALAHATRAGNAPAINVAFAADDAQLTAWSTQCGTAFARVAPWRWDQDGAAIAAAPDLLQGEFARAARTPPPRTALRFRWAIALAGIAFALHVGATVVEWGWLRFDSWRTARALATVARSAGVVEHSDPGTVAAGLARKFADARHQAGLPAPSDALPLLARAAPSLAALPAGQVKIATYTPGQWTFDLVKLDANAVAALERNLAQQGLATLHATTSSGTRVRTTLAPGMDAP